MCCYGSGALWELRREEEKNDFCIAWTTEFGDLKLGSWGDEVGRLGLRTYTL